MEYRVDPQAETPPWRQLVDRVLDAVATGETRPGDRLPSVRGMAADALVNPNTVLKAYRDLERRGVDGRLGQPAIEGEVRERVRTAPADQAPDEPAGRQHPSNLACGPPDAPLLGETAA